MAKKLARNKKYLDFKGRIIWRKEIKPYKTFDVAIGTSPIVYENGHTWSTEVCSRLPLARVLMIELNAEGTDYTNRGEFEADDFLENWKHVRGVLREMRTKPTRKDILDDWPGFERDLQPRRPAVGFRQ